MKEIKMTFIEHLEELRKRILWSLAAILICFIVAYTFSKKIFDFLMKPIIENLPQGSTLIFTRPAEGFTTYLRVGFFAALVVALPFILYQTWRFVAPALYKHEKQIAIPFIVFGTICFGLVFEFPLIVFVLAKLGIVNSNMLKRKRRYAIVICAIAAAIITPTTDAFSMVLMLVPLIVFYELGVIVAAIFGKKKEEVTSLEEKSTTV